MTPIKKVVFDVSKWSTGSLSTKYSSQAEPVFCALGFYMNQVGFSAQELQKGSTPFRLNVSMTSGEREAWAQKLVEAGADWLVCPTRDYNGDIVHFADSPDAAEIFSINDSINDEVFEDDEEREHFDNKRRQNLTDLFAKHGIEVEFK